MKMLTKWLRCCTPSFPCENKIWMGTLLFIMLRFWNAWAGLWLYGVICEISFPCEGRSSYECTREFKSYIINRSDWQDVQPLEEGWHSRLQHRALVGSWKNCSRVRIQLFRISYFDCVHSIQETGCASLFVSPMFIEF